MSKLRDKPCHCGWAYMGFHVCADLTTPEPPIAKPKRKKRAYVPKSPNEAKRGSEEWKAAVRAGRAGYDERLQSERTARDVILVEKYASGMTFKEISEELNLNHQTVSRAIHAAARANLVTIRPAKVRSALERPSDESIIECYKAGLGMMGTAHQLKVGHLYVREIVHKAAKDGKLVISKGGAPSKVDDIYDQVVEMYQRGMTIREINVETNISRSVVQKALYRAQALGVLTIRSAKRRPRS